MTAARCPRGPRYDTVRRAKAARRQSRDGRPAQITPCGECGGHHLEIVNQTSRIVEKWT